MLRDPSRPAAPSGRALALVAAASVALFVVLLLAIRPYGIGFDEAKYLGIGASIWAGRGPESAFGSLFLLHSPLWMGLLYGPQALLGVDAVAWGHVLNGLSGAGVVAIAVVMGRRVSPVAGVIAGFAMLAFAYLLDLSRTVRLDVPAAFMALLYLEVGWRAVRAGSVRWAIAAGLTFAVAVLVKEVAIPLAPVPILCAALAGLPWRRVLRSTGWIALAAAVGLAPWFLYYAAMTGRVYRVESAAWTLPLLVLPVLLLIVVGLAANRLAEADAVERLAARARDRLPARVVALGRPLVGWGTTIAWSALFLFFFSRIARLKGSPLVQLGQWRLYLGQWKWELAPIGLFIVLGAALALAMLWRDREAPGRRGAVNALVASICGLPLVIMVIQVGEPPRNYIAQIATAVVFAAAGWAWGIARLLERLTAGGRRPMLARAGLPVVLALVAVAGSAVVGQRAWATRAGGGDASERSIAAAVGWLEANVPHGAHVAFGSFLGYEMAYPLVGDYELFQVRHKSIVADPTQPQAFKRPGEPPATDWVAVDTAPRNVNEYQAFRAAWVESELREGAVDYWVYSTGPSTAAPAILNQLTPEHGFTQVATWTFADPQRSFTVQIFRVDRSALALDGSRLYLSSKALVRVTALLASKPDQSKTAAATLLDTAVVYDPSPAADAAMAQLRTIAGR